MMRAAVFAIVFLTGTACHREIKKLDSVAAVETGHKYTETVTTAPTERVTEHWYFRITPGIGRALPGGGKAIPADAPGFVPTKGLGYDVDEYERITEKLEPVATTKTTDDKKTDVTVLHALDGETDVGPGFKFYLAIGIAMVLLVAGAYAYFKFAPPNLLSSLVKKVLP